MKYIKYLNTKTILHNFKEVVSLTNQLGIKNAIIYNANDYLFTVGKNFVANKIDKLQDEFIIGMNFCKFEDVNNVCRYLEKINPKLYKKYLNQSNGDNIRFVKEDQIYYRLPYDKNFFFKCKDRTKIICRLYSGDFYDSISIFFIGQYRKEHADFLMRYCDKYRSKFITIKTLQINKQDRLEYSMNEQIDGVDEKSIIFPEKYQIFDYLNAWLQSETYFTSCGINHKIGICITKISTFLILCDLAVCLATLYVSFSLVFALMRYLQGKVFLIRFYSPTTLSSSRAEFRLPSRLACA